MLQTLLPRVADNRYPGWRLGLWLFALMLLKIPMGLNVVAHAPQVARSADGVPVDTFGDQAAAAFSLIFAAWGISQVVLGLLCVVVLLRYRSLVPLMFVVLLIEQSGRMALRNAWPIERVAAPGLAINMVLAAIMAGGLALSLWRRRRSATNG